MNATAIQQILDWHAIPVKTQGDYIFGLVRLSKGLGIWENLTGYTLRDLRIWLGY